MCACLLLRYEAKMDLTTSNTSTLPSTGYTILPVDSDETRRQFIEVPFNVYRSDPNWIARPRAAVLRQISAQSNPFFAEAEIQNFVAVGASGECLGRVAGVVHPAYNARKSEKHAYFGLFECVRDESLARALLTEVEQWAAHRGCTRMIGPYGYSITQTQGVLIENVDGLPAALSQSYSPNYYSGLLEAAGFRQAFTTSAYSVSRGGRTELPETWSKMAERLRKRYRVTVASAWRPDVQAAVEDVRVLYNRCIETHSEMMPVSEPVFRAFAVPADYFLRQLHIVSVDGKPAGVFLVLPNFNEVMARMRGKFGLVGRLRMLWCRHFSRTGVVCLAALDPAFRSLGIGLVMADEIARRGAKRFDHGHTVWIDDRGETFASLATEIGARVSKRYAVFAKAIPPVTRELA